MIIIRAICNLLIYKFSQIITLFIFYIHNIFNFFINNKFFFLNISIFLFIVTDFSNKFCINFPKSILTKKLFIDFFHKIFKNNKEY